MHRDGTARSSKQKVRFTDRCRGADSNVSRDVVELVGLEEHRDLSELGGTATDKPDDPWVVLRPLHLWLYHPMMSQSGRRMDVNPAFTHLQWQETQNRQFTSLHTGVTLYRGR